MNIDDLKAATKTLEEIERTERLLALYREWEGEFILGTPPSGRLSPVERDTVNNQLRLKAPEIVDHIVTILERRLELMRVSLKDAGVDPT